jgi:hypothetical protein
MANKDLPVGAHPHGVPRRVTGYKAGGTIYPGDFIKLKSDGTVEVATALDALVGVAATYAASGATVMVYDDPAQLFVVQSDDNSVDAQTDINLNYSITATAGDTTYRVSRHELDGNTGATDSNLPLKLLKIDGAVDNALGAAVDCIVKINNHQLSGGTGTTGV